MAIQEGKFYSAFLKDVSYTSDVRSVVEATVTNLLQKQTSLEHPGMLLGMIQSGKTKSFVRTIALAFDNGFEATIVLTKGTRALAQQTFERLQAEFAEFLENDEILLFDIMHLPGQLTSYELNKKLILVVKKEANNLQRLDTAIAKLYPRLQEKRTLIIDDEADFASIGFRTSKVDGLQINKITRQINEIRGLLHRSSFLQVTATPYSLYLQPANITINSEVFKPIRPAFTGSLPAYKGYVGGDFYFRESLTEDSPARYLFDPVPDDELAPLRKEDRRVVKIEEVLTSKRINSLRNAIVNFIVGASIRRIQDRMTDRPQTKFSFIVHTESNKRAHTWQDTLVRAIIAALKESIVSSAATFEEVIRKSYDNLQRSIKALERILPDFDKVIAEVTEALNEEYVMISTVNSENDINQLLDNKGQLRLRTPMNIFIGGQILDRGITIGNLIGFFYGRRPNRFQQDTVLQHARMYGARPKEDLAVTRFYTTEDIHDALKRIHELDQAMREAIMSGNQDLVFIYTDDNGKIMPCSPNKILASSTTTLKPHKRILPIGFQTKYKSYTGRTLTDIDETLASIKNDPIQMSLGDASTLIRKIYDLLDLDESFGGVDAKEFTGILTYLANRSSDAEIKGKVAVIVRRDRNIARWREGYGPSDLPENRRDELALAREIGKKIPVLILLRQNGLEENGWRDTPFWWPILVAPEETRSAVYARDLNQDDPSEALSVDLLNTQK